ncbi:alpha/beta fold hydrolase [Acerihabitans arboris]|uniref:Alpha/beta fold hydrolase n=1 Tax=Acerihabitans arboris TaxID=2691583 RepID=A0A845SEG0_9GAMM|nr:alpha/beta hydrolase [Acerihabitans arboris]NDL63333.1 alpha/beta fold hydrolase [Acerihabitans arboris]
MKTRDILHVRTPMLDLAYEEHGPEDGAAVILLHGFPYDPRAYDNVAPPLAARGYRVLVPYLRGYGPTRFVDAGVMRSGQQAALAQDLLDLMDALSIKRAALAGYDWGGRAACILAALWPARVSALVTGDGYNIQDIAAAVQPLAPEAEYRYWYQYYFHTPRGRAGLTANRAALCRLLWRLWSPTWPITDAVYAQSAESFDNPDFVEVVIHSYRHRYGYAAGDPRLQAIEDRLQRQPVIAVPAISLCGLDDGVGVPETIDPRRAQFSRFYERRLLPGTGHNIPQESPGAMVDAVLDLLSGRNI